ncbi:MAG: DUF5684 domain-containing protein [Coriobacteriia bacterium]|nr:DUF5684 domain-containing protein [Coriobacteriia bacterium]
MYELACLYPSLYFETSTATRFDLESMYALMTDPIFNLVSSMCILITLIFLLIGVALVFEKAGEKWWKALIPFYCEWTETKVAGAPASWFWVFISLYVVGGFILALGFSLFGLAMEIGIMGPNAGLLAASIVFMFASKPFFIVGAIFYGRILYKLSRAFGKGLGFALGLLFLGPIFWMILAFDKSQYQPVAEEGPAHSGYPSVVQQSPYQHYQQMPPAAQQGQFSQYPQQQVPHMHPPSPQVQAQIPQEQQPYPQQTYGQYGQQPTQPYGQTPPDAVSAAAVPYVDATLGQQPAPASYAGPKRLSRAAIVGIILLILIPLGSCCIWAEYVINVAGQTGFGSTSPYF